MVHSEDLQKAASERLERYLCPGRRSLNWELYHLSHKTFPWRADALQAVEAFCAEHIYTSITGWMSSRSSRWPVTANEVGQLGGPSPKRSVTA
jgi:hypothetical protein